MFGWLDSAEAGFRVSINSLQIYLEVLNFFQSQEGFSPILRLVSGLALG